MIEIKSLKKIYKLKNQESTVALDDVNLKIDKTGMVFILGKSGSGKSTLLNILAGLDNPSQGEILINNKSLSNFTQDQIDSYRNSYIGFIFQEYNLIEDFTLRENIEISLNLQGKEVKNKELEKILEKVDLLKEIDRKTNELSGGQIQRVAIARALIKNPQIIMADEPSGALDSKTGTLIFELLKDLSKEKLVIVVSHDREFANKYADRIIEIADGKVVNDTRLAKTNESNNNLVFKKDFIYYPKDYELTNEDYDKINDYIIEHKEYENIRIKPMTDFDFSDTNQEDIIIEDKPINLKKSKLPLKKSIKIGYNTLKRKIVKLITTIFLTTTAFMFLGVTLSIANYSLAKTQINVLQKAPYDYFAMTKNFDTEDSTIPGLSFLQEDIDYITRELDKDLIEYFSFANLGNFDKLYKTSSAHVEPFDTGDKVYLSTSSEEKIKNFGYNLKYGIYPKTSTEVAITEYIFESFKLYSYKNLKTAEVTKIESYEDIIGKEIYFYRETFTIVGIIDTGYNEKEFDLIKGMFSLDIYESKDYEMVNLANKYDFEREFIHSALFFTERQNWTNLSSTDLVIGKLERDKRSITELINFTRNIDSEGSRFALSKMPLIGNLEEIDYLLKQLSQVFLIIGLIFAGFSVLLLTNFIVQSINFKQKDIGILRAIGARKIDTFKIFMAESGIIAVINVIMSFLFTNLGNLLINNTIKKEIFIDNFVVAGFIEFIILTATIVISTILATLFAVKRHVSKTPIDTIQKSL